MAFQDEPSAGETKAALPGEMDRRISIRDTIELRRRVVEDADQKSASTV